MEEKTHVFFVMVQHLTELPPGYLCVVEDLIIRAFSVKILMYAMADVRK